MVRQGAKWETVAKENKNAGAYPLIGLMGSHHRQTAILVAIGNSLDNNLAKLKCTHSPILAVYRAFPALMMAHIVPDYVFMIDAIQPYLPVSHDDTKNIPLMCARKSSPEVRSKWSGPLYEFDDIVGDCDWSEEYRRQNPYLTLLPGGGNVSTLMLNIAVNLLGFRRIVFVGHDFWTSSPNEYDMQNESYRMFLRWTVQCISYHMNNGHEAVEFINCSHDWEKNVPPELRWVIHNTIPMELEEALGVYAL